MCKTYQPASYLPWRKERPRTDGDYRDLLAPYDVPVVTHELGQWWVYPNFAELPKYRGNLRARAAEALRARYGASARATRKPLWTVRRVGGQ